MFQTVELKVVQGENRSRSTSFSNQSCINFYIDNQKSGRTQFALMPWPGEKSFSLGVSGKKTRGFRVVNGVPYILNGTSLYRIKEDGSQVYLAKVPGSQIVSMADDGYNLIIRNSGSIAFVNQKFIFSGNGATYLWNTKEIKAINVPTFNNPGEYVSTQVDSTTSFNAIGEARLLGDDILQVFAFQKKIIMGGTDSIEIFVDTGDTPQPINSAQQAATNKVGVGSRLSMAETPNFLYLLGADNVVYRMSNIELSPISSSAISRVISNANKKDAQGFTCNLDGQWFYILQMPYDNLTLAFSEATGEWVRLATGTGLPIQRHLISGYGECYNKKLVADNDSADVYEWDFNTYKSNNNIIVRQFDTAPINGLMLGAAGQRLIAKKVQLIMQTGVGSTKDRDPQIMVQYSIDGGRTYSEEQWLRLRREGESTSLVDFYVDHTFYDIQFRVKISDPVFSSFHSGSIEIKAAGY